MPPPPTITLRFPHGLGDCVHFAHVLVLHQRRGDARFVVAAPADKHAVFRPLDVVLTESAGGALDVPWHDALSLENGPDPAAFWLYNKAGRNVAAPPLPPTDTPEALWPRLCDVRLRAAPFVSGDAKRAVRDFLAPLPRPVVLLHTHGNTCQGDKNLPGDTVRALYRGLLDRTDGALVLLDWDDRVPRLANGRVRHLSDDWRRIDTETLLALIDAADLLVGIDSGPLHAARLTDTPALGVFPRPTHHPTRFCLPRARQANLVPRNDWNVPTRIAFNLVAAPGDALDADFIATHAARMLGGPRYLGDAELGADVQLQQFVLDWERGVGASFLSDFQDRHRGFDVALRETAARSASPVAVETGCVRAPEDWGGAGFGTYLLGAYLQRAGGRLVSVDIDAANCAFARSACRELPRVEVVCGDSVAFLADFPEPIDLLVLDSVDSEEAHAAEHARREIEAALPRLHERSVVVFDDTPWGAGAFRGKGALAVPWLLARGGGWRILYAGYQVVLAREP